MGAENTAHELLDDVHALLKFQGELELDSLTAPEAFLEIPKPVQAPRPMAMRTCQWSWRYQGRAGSCFMGGTLPG